MQLPTTRSRVFPGKYMAKLFAVAILLVISFVVDHYYASQGEWVDLTYFLPITAAAVMLSPLGTLGVAMISMMSELTSEVSPLQKVSEDYWTPIALGLYGLLAVGFCYLGRRFMQDVNAIRDDLIKSPIAYATFGFPGYSLTGYNEAYDKMLPAGFSGKSLIECLPGDGAAQLAGLFDEAITSRKQVNAAEFPIPGEEGRSTFWNINIIPAAAQGRSTPKSVSLFAVDVSDAISRGRTRDAALRISTSVMASLDLQETVHVVLESLAQIAQTNAGGLLLIEDDQWVGTAGWGEYTDEMVRKIRWPYDDMPTGVRAIESKLALAIEDATTDSRFSSERARVFNIMSALVVPMVSGNRPIGACWLTQTDEFRHFTDEQVEFATVIGTQAALAIENATIYENEHIARKSLEAIEAVSEVGLSSLDLDEVLMELVNRAQNAMKMDAAVIFLADERREHLEVRAATGRSARSICGTLIDIDSGSLAGRAFLKGAPVKIDQLTGQEEVFCPSHDAQAVECPFADCHGIQSGLAVPLELDGRIAGVLQLGSRAPSAFSAREWSLIQVLAERASLAVQNSMHHRAIQQELARLALLRDVAAACAGLSDLDGIAERVLEAVYERLGCRAASIYYLDREREVLVNVAFRGHPADVMEDFREIPLNGDSYIPRAVRDMEVIIHDGTEGEMPEAVQRVMMKLEAEDSRRIYLPIIYDHEAVGAIAMLFPGLRPFSKAAVETLKGISSQLALAIKNSSIHGSRK